MMMMMMKYSWQYFTVSILLVEKSFMKNLLMTKSSDSKSDLVKRHALRQYKSRQKSSVAFDLKALRFEREQHVGNPKHTASVDDCSEYWLGNFANRSLYFYAGGC